MKKIFQTLLLVTGKHIADTNTCRLTTEPTPCVGQDMEVDFQYMELAEILDCRMPYSVYEDIYLHVFVDT